MSSKSALKAACLLTTVSIAISLSGCASYTPVPISNKQKGMDEYQVDNAKCAALAKRYEKNLWLQNVEQTEIPRLKRINFSGCMHSRGYVGGDIYVEPKGPERDFD